MLSSSVKVGFKNAPGIVSSGTGNVTNDAWNVFLDPADVFYRAWNVILNI